MLTTLKTVTDIRVQKLIFVNLRCDCLLGSRNSPLTRFSLRLELSKLIFLIKAFRCDVNQFKLYVWMTYSKLWCNKLRCRLKLKIKSFKGEKILNLQSSQSSSSSSSKRGTVFWCHLLPSVFARKINVVRNYVVSQIKGILQVTDDVFDPVAHLSGQLLRLTFNCQIN